MCGRYTLVRLDDILERFPWIQRGWPDLMPRFNIAPTQGIPVIASDRPDQLQLFTWGLVPSWAKDPSIGNRLINARAETLADKPAFRNALKRRRCLVIADGFYEWQPQPGSKSKIPLLIRMKDHRPFAFAGLWDRWESPDGSEILSCTIITTAANELMRPIHDRMPAIIPPDQYRRWLDVASDDLAAIQSLLAPYPAAEMEAMVVSTYVNSPSNEGQRCIEPVEKETLF